jgi:hypothetical protein
MAIAWMTPTFNAGNFTVSALTGTWTVDAGDVTTFRFRRVGKTITLSFVLVNTSVTGSGGVRPGALRLTIPVSATAKRRTSAAITVNDNGTVGLGYCTMTPGGSTIDCYLASEGQWANSTNATGVAGEITFEMA